MSMPKIILWISVLILMTGCKTTLQSNWKNFNAYYNTFYNAEKSFEAGLEKNLGQNREYNPLQPIRVHQKPVNAGAQDFEKAIQKSADILRRHEDSKWVDDAIYIIGKSYYYRQDYFSADQKFRELYITTDEPEMQHLSILWQGRVLLELELYNEGVVFLNEQLSLNEESWDKKITAEAKILLAQHYVELGDWQPAATNLAEGLPDLPEKALRERGYFLLGQIYERVGDMEAAYQAYSSVEDHISEYRVQYLAQRKRAEVARNLGRNDLAFSIFDDMIRDDKNLEYRSELDFELAKTEHERENYQQAELLYNNVLHNRNSQPPAEIRAQAYYGLAEIQRFGYDDFTKAAAYYDSAAQVNVAAERLPEEFEAQELAESFGNYARIKSESAHQDSLLRLGQLSQAELDSVIAETRLKKIEELEALRDEQQQQRDQMTSVNQDEAGTEQNTGNGFLNEKSVVQQQNSRQQFYATWGNRPLADNWRARSMIRASTFSNEIDEDEIASEDSELLNIEIDLSDIPFTQEAQDSVRKNIAAYDYELGNLFFLSLNMPDSAIYYFERAVQRPSNDNINMVSLYSLSEIYASEGNEVKSREYALKLVDEYPSTLYAQRISEQYDLSMGTGQGSLSEVDPIQLYRVILEQDSLDETAKAERLLTFSRNFSTHEVADDAQFEAIQLYMSSAKKDSAFDNKMEIWIESKRERNENFNEFKATQDSASIMLQDTTITEEQRSAYQTMTDSTFEEPDLSEVFPYRGEYWDSTRAIIDTFLEMFPDSGLQPRVTRLNTEFQIPDETMQDQDPETDEEVPSMDGGDYLNCDEIGEQLAVRGGIAQFMGNINIREQQEIEELRYLFRVNQRGVPDEFTLLTENVGEDLKQEFDQQIQESLSFEPVLYEGQAVALECEITFPINNIP
ncbi:MAG: hypothetical protein WD053_08055 [Gracilimonas sp.]